MPKRVTFRIVRLGFRKKIEVIDVDMGLTIFFRIYVLIETVTKDTVAHGENIENQQNKMN